MAKKRKAGGGRKPLPATKKKKQVAFRAEPHVIAALEKVAKRNERVASTETLFAVKKHLREQGELPEEK